MTSLGKRSPWHHLKVEHAKPPKERAYILGKAAAGEKQKPIVDITQTKSEQYKKHIWTMTGLLVRNLINSVTIMGIYSK